ncbi:MAG: ATP-binding protein, partial [Planctomycetota bacterium]
GRKTDGWGLGLLIASEVARRHGGQLDIDGTPRRGTCILLRLPQVRPNT